MKTYQKFIIACENEKVKILIQEAVWLAWREDGDFNYDLYDLMGVYVEIKVSLQTSERCYYLFTDTAGLNPYLPEIDISSAIRPCT
jgi:hypothetical protein